MNDLEVITQVKINIACGEVYHQDWINIDFQPHSAQVKKVNIIKGLPFSDNFSNVIYSSHFLEHLTKEQGLSFLRECYRCLDKNGQIRIVVPDFEELCESYLRYQKSGELAFAQFCKLQMIDQCVRMKSGGKLLEFYRGVHESDRSMINFVFERIGQLLPLENDNLNKTFLEKCFGVLKSIRKIKNLARIVYIESVLLLLPRSLTAQMFSRASLGEKHLWIYDFTDLKQQLEAAGFSCVQKMSCSESRIVGFEKYDLDVNEGGHPRHGVESMYVEAVK